MIFVAKTFTDCLLLLCQMTPHPQILRRKLLRIATKLQIHQSFLPQKFPAVRYVVSQQSYMYHPVLCI